MHRSVIDLPLSGFVTGCGCFEHVMSGNRIWRVLASIRV
jgi:hypothetical protein